MASKFELKKSGTGQFTFNLKAANGRVILTGEQYRARAGALGGIESVKKFAARDASFERKTAANGQAYFVLKAANGQTIGRSELYPAAATMEKGIAAVKSAAPAANIVDLTA